MTRFPVLVGITATALFFLSLTGSAFAIDSVQDGDINDPLTWSGGALPTAGDTNTWTILHTVSRDTDNSPSGTSADITDQTFLGQTLVIGNGTDDNGELSLESGSHTLTVNDVVLNQNGKIETDRDTSFLIGDTITFNGDGGHISSDRNSNNRRMALNFENFNGEGTVYFFGNNANGARNVEFETSNADPGQAWSGFSGTLHVDVVNGDGGAISWTHDIDVATFDIILSDLEIDLPPAENNAGARGTLLDPLPSVNGKLNLPDDIDIKVTGLRLIDDFDDGTNNIDVSLADGVYTLDTVANPGAIDLTNVGGVDYSRFFFGGTGTVEVIGGGGGPTPLAGDFNGDGTVDAADYTLYVDNLGQADESAFAAGTGDGMNGVDPADYTLWRANFGNTTPPLIGGGGGAVPEPTALSLLALAGAVSVAVRFRRR